MTMCNWNIKSAVSTPDNLGKLPSNTEAAVVPVDDSYMYVTSQKRMKTRQLETLAYHHRLVLDYSQHTL